MPSFRLLLALATLAACGPETVEGQGCYEVAGTEECRPYDGVRPGDVYAVPECGSVVEVTGAGTYSEPEGSAFALCCYPTENDESDCESA